MVDPAIQAENMTIGTIVSMCRCYLLANMSCGAKASVLVLIANGTLIKYFCPFGSS